jgi:hypothetical protein
MMMNPATETEGRNDDSRYIYVEDLISLTIGYHVLVWFW